jgi:heat shock protein HtpX
MNNILKTTLLMGLLMGLCLAVGDAIGGRQGLYMAFVFGGIGNLFAYWFSDKMILWTSGARPADESEVPQVYRVLRFLSQSAGMPMPKVYLIETPMPNAFATGRNPSHAAVAVTTGILSMLNENELRGVLGHELSHVRHRDILISTIAAIMAGAVMMLARMAQWSMMFGGYGGRDRERDNTSPIVYILMIILAPIAAMLIQLAISRSREFDADQGGAKLTGDPLSLASALEKIEHAGRRGVAAPVSPVTAHLYIVNPLSLEGIRRLFSTHPPTEERVARLRSMYAGG